MEKIFSKISNLKNKIDSLLHEEFGQNLELQSQIQKNFKVQTDISTIKDISIGLPQTHVDKAVILFQRLAAFANAGMFLENQDGLYKLYATFQNGIVSPIKTEPRPVMNLPHTDLLTVLQTPAANILQKVSALKLSNSEDHRAFMIKISADFTVILFCEMPDPWMKNHIENLHRAITLAMGEA